MQIVTQTDITEYKLLNRGKVRDIYDVDDALLIVTTDRISAFDVVLPDPIPYKGVILNKMTLFWMEMFKDMIPNHIIASEPADFPAPLAPHADMLDGRAVLVKKADPLPIECIVRGYITGSGWKDYLSTGTVCGHDLPENLKESQELDPPLFTPSTKADIGMHDENISTDKAADLVGRKDYAEVERISLEMYRRAREYARTRGIIIADTKFEFGRADGEIILIDEVLTPDSSRFWPADQYEPGRSQPSFDKQFVRDWLKDIGFNKQPPAPNVPAEIAAKTRAKYLDAYVQITGHPLDLP